MHQKDARLARSAPWMAFSSPRVRKIVFTVRTSTPHSIMSVFSENTLSKGENIFRSRGSQTWLPIRITWVALKNSEVRLHHRRAKW